MVIGSVLLTGILATMYVLVCHTGSTYGSLYHFDVPPCSSVSSCAKKAFPYEGYYSYTVGEAWYRANDVTEAVADARDLCSLRLTDENGNPIKSAVRKLKNGLWGVYSKIDSLIWATNNANVTLIEELSSLKAELDFIGVGEVNHAGWLSLYSEVNSALFDLSEHTEYTEMGRIYNEIFALSDVEPGGTVFINVVQMVATGALVVIEPFVAPITYPIFTILKYGTNLHQDLSPFVNLSVGNRRSLLTEYRRLVETYVDLQERTMDEAEKLYKESRDVREEILEEVEPLRDENLSVLASFLPSRVEVGTLTSPMAFTPLLVISRANTYYRAVEENYWRFRHEGRYLAHFERLRENHDRLLSLKHEVDRFLVAVKNTEKACMDSVKSHRFNSPELKARVAELVVRFKYADVVERARICERATEIVERDKRLGNVVGALKDCEERYKEWWGEAAPCHGEDPALNYSCCERAFEQRMSEYLSSEDYQRYKELLDTLLDLSVSQGLEDILGNLYTLPRTPKPSNLPKYTAKLLSLIDKASSELSSSVDAAWSGHLSTTSLTEVTLSLTNDLPLSLEGKLKIPFDYVGYRVEGNGMTVDVAEGYVHYRGRGSAKVTFQVPPVDVQEGTISTRDGFLTVSIINPYDLPLEVPVKGEVASLRRGLNEGNYVVLSPGGAVVFHVPALTIERNQVGDTAYFLLRNTSTHDYSGIVSLDVNATSGPSFCVLTPNRAICKVNVPAGEERLLKFKGYILPGTENALSFAPPRGEDVPEEVITSVSRKEGVTGVDERFQEALEALKSMWKRAKELNATDLLPFTEETIDNLESLDPSLQDEALPVAEGLVSQVESTARARTEMLQKLAEKTGDPDLTNIALMAKKSLLTGDYVTPLALSRSLDRYFYSTGASSLDPVPYVLLALALAFLFVHFRRTSPPRKKKRIPRF